MSSYDVTIVICVTLLFMSLMATLVWILNNERKERRELYDRIQAGTLRDYVYAEDIRKQPTDEPIGDSNPVLDEDYDPNEIDIVTKREDSEMNAELERLRGGYASTIFGKGKDDGE